MDHPIKGRRIYPDHHAGQMFKPGDYGIEQGEWMAYPPEKTAGLGALSAHTVTEHEDKTITVKPSILISDGYRKPWHGYLKKGIWTKA